MIEIEENEHELEKEHTTRRIMYSRIVHRNGYGQLHNMKERWAEHRAARFESSKKDVSATIDNKVEETDVELDILGVFYDPTEEKDSVHEPERVAAMVYGGPEQNYEQQEESGIDAEVRELMQEEMNRGSICMCRDPLSAFLLKENLLFSRHRGSKDDPFGSSSYLESVANDNNL